MQGADGKLPGHESIALPAAGDRGKEVGKARVSKVTFLFLDPWH